MPESTAAAGAIVLGFDPSTAIVTQEASAATSDVMVVRVPFYVGNSVAQAPGFSVPLFFPASTLPSIVQEAKADIEKGDQPLTVYARHADALDPKEVPIGRIVNVMQEGDRGYADLAISKAGKGAVVQQLIHDKVLNAVSLRSRGDWEMERAKVNGELVLEAKRLPLAGIDFAPEGPAQPTYGIRILQEDPRVEPVVDEPVEDEAPEKEEPDQMEPITLEAVRANAAIVTEIEKPLRDELESAKAQLATVTQERDSARERVVTLEGESAKREIATFVSETAAKFPEAAREAALKVLQEKTAESKTVDEARAALAPIMLDLSLKLVAEAPATAVVAQEGGDDKPEMVDATTLLFEMVRPRRERIVTQEGETPAVAATSTKETVMGLEIPD